MLSDDARAGRLLALTGLTPDALRSGLAQDGGQPVMVAVLDFLMGHERDLVAAAAALGVEPQALVAARASLARGSDA